MSPLPRLHFRRMSPDGVDPRPADHAGTTNQVIDMGQQPIDGRRPLPWHLFAAVVLVVVAGVVGCVIGDHHRAAMTLPISQSGALHAVGAIK
jgi:hypothetical protein